MGWGAIGLFFFLLRNQAVVKRKNSQELPDSAVGFQALNANRIVPPENRQLVNLPSEPQTFHPASFRSLRVCKGKDHPIGIAP
jgi:hypothetical protein